MKNKRNERIIIIKGSCQEHKVHEGMGLNSYSTIFIFFERKSKLKKNEEMEED